MEWIKCKNDHEKIEAIRRYCENQVNECKYQIDIYKRGRESTLDYMYEIDELKARKRRFQTILDIIAADEFTSVMII